MTRPDRGIWKWSTQKGPRTKRRSPSSLLNWLGPESPLPITAKDLQPSQPTQLFIFRWFIPLDAYRAATEQRADAHHRR